MEIIISYRFQSLNNYWRWQMTHTNILSWIPFILDVEINIITLNTTLTYIAIIIYAKTNYQQSPLSIGLWLMVISRSKNHRNALNIVLTKVPKRLIGTFDVIWVVEMRAHVFEFKYPRECSLDKTRIARIWPNKIYYITWIVSE